MASNWWESKREQEERLNSLRGTDNIICFSTSKMRDRGKVFHCTINKEGHAIVRRSESWWSMSFKETTERIGDDLGEVKIAQNSGSLLYHLEVANLLEGRG